MVLVVAQYKAVLTFQSVKRKLMFLSPIKIDFLNPVIALFG